MESKMIEQARDFALAKHAGQIRNLPDGSEPYFCHLMRVAEMVSNITEDVSCIIAALLHDTVEDTETTLAEIEAAFGLTVARLVDGLTDNYTPARHPDMNRKARKAAETARIATEDDRVHLVKLADLIDNLRSLDVSKGFGKLFAEEAGALPAVLSGPTELREMVEMERRALLARHEFHETEKNL